MTPIFIIVSIILSIISFDGGLYRWLEPRIGVGLGYVIDQGIPLIIVMLLTAALLQKRGISGGIKQLRKHIVPVILLLVAVVSAHGWILRYYFFAEDVSTILVRVNNGSPGFPFDPLINGYPFASFIASYLLFQTHAWFYNVISLVWFIFAVISFYFFVFELLGKRTIALLASLYFATTPIFLDVFSWQANAQGMPMVLGLHLVSFICMLRYKKFGQAVYLFMSVLFFVSAVKMGFVRIAGLVFPLIYLVWMPIKKEQPFWTKIGESVAFGTIWMGFIATRLVPGGLPAFIGSFTAPHAPSFRWEGYWEKLAYYMAHLVFPNTLGRFLFPLFKDYINRMTWGIYQPQSIVWILGISALASLAVLGVFVLFLPKKTAVSWFLLFCVLVIFGSMFYVPVYITTTTNKAIFDQYFIRATPPYGPGARYVFSAALGVSMLFGLFFSWLEKRKSGLIPVNIVLAGIVAGNIFLSTQSHRSIISSISNPERILINSFFDMVPRDGKPKLVYSVNPARNAIDGNVGGWRWLYGFYRRNELIYSNNEQEVVHLLSSGTYTRDRFFAFYANPETSAFADISEIARKDFFQKDTALPIPVPFEKNISQTEFTKAATSGIIYLAKRPILISREIGERVLKPKTLEFSLDRSPIADVPFPFSDALIVSKETRVPGQFWWMIKEYAPIAAKNIHEFISSLGIAAFQDRLLEEISFADRVGVNRIIREIDDIQRGIQVTVTGLDSSDPRVRASALADGLFASDPAPSKDDVFYTADTTPTVITLRLAFPVVLGRILMNTPKNMLSDHSPVEATVYASAYGGRYSSVGFINEDSKNLWSPNNGAMLTVQTAAPVLADSVRIEITKTSAEPVSFDEIVVVPQAGEAYTPAQIFEMSEKNWWYVGNSDVHTSLSAMNRYKNITLAWTCAEDKDWEKQKKNTRTLEPGVWRITKVPFAGDKEIIRANVDCHGSVLRTVMIIGPPDPSIFTLSSVRLL